LNVPNIAAGVVLRKERLALFEFNNAPQFAGIVQIFVNVKHRRSA